MDSQHERYDEVVRNKLNLHRSEKPPMVTTTIQFDLLTNATDSISYAIELLAWPDIRNDERRMKQAILSISQGVELLLKERLRRIHPAFMFEDVDKFPSLDARTVGAERALMRLKSISGYLVRDSDAQLMRDLRRTRNAIEHAEWHTTLAEAKAIVGAALSFAIDFAKSELDRDLSYEFRREDTWGQLLTELHEFAAAHARRLAANAGVDQVNMMTCDVCHHETLDRLEQSCPLCGHWNSDEEVPF